MIIRKTVCMRTVLVLTVLAGVVCSVATAGSLADFDDLTLAPDSAWSGDYNSDGTGGTYDSTTFASGGAEFVNHSDGDWVSWAGFAYSNKVDTTTSGWLNQSSTFAGIAHSGAWPRTSWPVVGVDQPHLLWFGPCLALIARPDVVENAILGLHPHCRV